MSKYQSKHVQTIFDISSETARSWAIEFQQYLSPTANPETGRTRKFTDEDMRVFATINRLRNDGLNFDEIHASLQSGTRDEVPVALNDELIDIAASQQGLMLMNQLQDIVQRVSALEEKQQQQSHRELERLRSEHDETVEELQTKINELYRQIGKLEARLEIEQEKKQESAKDDDN